MSANERSSVTDRETDLAYGDPPVPRRPVEVVMPVDGPAATLSDEQRAALTRIARWFSGGGYQPLTLGGLAGTGKTSLIGLLPQVFPETVIVFAAYTGKAVSVLRSKLSDVDGERISTIHSLLYKPQTTIFCTVSDIPMKEGERCQAHAALPEPCPMRSHTSYQPRDNPLGGIDLVVVDEASMVTRDIWADLTRYGVPVLAVGDHGQLPPVRGSFNLMANPMIRLEEIHRQAASDPAGIGILNVARWARERGYIPVGVYGPGVIKIQPHQLGYAGLHPGDADLIICSTNRTRQWHNTAMRNLHGRHGPPQPGDKVICLRNRKEEGLFNGQSGVITEIGETISAGETPVANMTITLDGLDEPWTGLAAMDQFGALATLSDINRSVALFDFGYAQTTYKSQGSEADRVIVIEESWPAGDLRKRSLYTAVTRARRELTVVGN